MPPPNTEHTTLSAIEASKRSAAQQAVKEHFDPSAKYIGIGSGSTIVYVVQAIGALDDPRVKDIRFVPTGYQSRRVHCSQASVTKNLLTTAQVIIDAGLHDMKFDSLPAGELIDVAFDGADEIDDDLNCVKGGGACLYQEKLVAMRAKKFICVADHRKLQSRLLTKWPTIPIEVEPLATDVVLSALRELGSTQPRLREGQITKAGPIKTDQDNFIVDAPFPTLLLPQDVQQYIPKDGMRKSLEGKGLDGIWEVANLAREIKLIEGVLSVGLFVGENGVQASQKGANRGGQKPVAAFFGMEDGSVVVREANEDGTAKLREN